MILGDNPAEHCFVLSSNELFQMSYVCVTENAHRKQNGNICLKARDTFFFQNVVCDQGRDGGTQMFGGGDIQQKGKVQAFELAERLS